MTGRASLFLISVHVDACAKTERALDYQIDIIKVQHLRKFLADKYIMYASAYLCLQYILYCKQGIFKAAVNLIRANVIQDLDGLLVSRGEQINEHIQSSPRADLESLRNQTINTAADENCDLLHTTSQLGIFNSFMPYPLPLVLQVLVIVLTLFTNSITIAVFARPAMQNPTNTMLTGIAVADLFTVLLPLPLILLKLCTHIMNDPITVLKGYLVQYLSSILPTVCHTAAIWLTVLLAIQRTIYVQMPMQAVHCWVCQPKAAKLTVLFTCFLAALTQLHGVLQTSYKYVITFCNTTGGSYTAGIAWGRPTLIKCTHMPKEWYTGLLLLRVVTVNLIPCITLTLLTILLTWALHRFTVNRRRLLGRSKSTQKGTGLTTTTANASVEMQNNGDHEDRLGSSVSLTKREAKGRENTNSGASSSEKDSTSMMLLVILIIFLMAELPTTVLICLATHQINNADQSGLKMGSELCNYIILLSYPANFFVYVSMSRPFRTNLSQLFSRSPRANMTHHTEETGTRSLTCFPLRYRKSNRRHGDYFQAATKTPNQTEATAELVGKLDLEIPRDAAVVVEPKPDNVDLH